MKELKPIINLLDQTGGKTWIFISLFFFLFSISSFSQNEIDETAKEDSIDALLDDFFFDELIAENLEIKKFHILYPSFTFNSNTFFAGRPSDQNQFNFTPQITYVNTNGLSLGVSGVYLQNFSPSWDVTQLNIGYSKHIDKKKRFAAFGSYARYFFTSGNEGLFSNQLTFGSTYSPSDSSFYANVSFNYYFGEVSFIQVIPSISYEFNLIKPRQVAPQNENPKQTKWISSSNVKSSKKITLKSSHIDLSFKPQLSLFFNKENINTTNNFFLFTEVQNTNVSFFGLSYSQLRVPLILNVKNFDFEVSYYLNLGNPTVFQSNFVLNNFVGFSIGYLFLL